MSTNMKFDFMGIVVADIAKSIAFYRLLGWVIPDLEAGNDHHETVLPNGIRVGWDTVALMKQI